MRDHIATTLFLVIITAFMAITMALLPDDTEAYPILRPTLADTVPELKPTLHQDGPISHRIDHGGHAYRVAERCWLDQPGSIEGGISLATTNVAEGCYAYDDTSGD